MNDEKLLELASLKACGQHSWEDIGRQLGIGGEVARGRWRRNCRDIELGPCPICSGRPGEGDDQSSWQESGNYAEGTVRHRGDPLPLDEFLDLLRVDRGIWRVLDWEASTWQQNVNRRGELKFTGSILDGHLEYSPEIIDLWAHRAKFIRREPVALRPVVQPVECPVSYDYPLRAHVEEYSLTSGLIFGDLHLGYERDNRTGQLRPFHDRAGIGLILGVVHLFDTIVIDGDFLDLTNWNDRFLRSPDFYYTTQPAILEAHWILRQIRASNPDAEIVYIPGNHEDRMGKMLQKHLIEAYGLKAADEIDLPPSLSPERLLALDRLGIVWAEDGEYWLGPVRVSHGEIARKPPGASTRAMVEDNQCDNVFGHTHRLEMVSKVVRTSAGAKTVKSVSTACLCHIDGRVPGSKLGDNWQRGFVTVEYSAHGWTPSLVSYNDARMAIVGGEMYWGADYVNQLRKDLPDWNW